MAKYNVRFNDGYSFLISAVMPSMIDRICSFTAANHRGMPTGAIETKADVHCDVRRGLSTDDQFHFSFDCQLFDHVTEDFPRFDVPEETLGRTKTGHIGRVSDRRSIE